MADANFQVKKGLTVPRGTASTPSIIFDAADTNCGLYSPGDDQVAISLQGSESAPALSFGNDSDTGIYRPGADQVAISTNGTGRLFVDASGNVGIGTTSPGVALHVDGDIRCDGVYGETDTNTSIQFPGSDVITFNEGGAEAARIDSSGRLLVGTSTSADLGSSIQTAQTTGTGAFEAFQFSNSAAYPYITFAKSRGASVGTNAIVQNGDRLGEVVFRGANGTGYDTAASITAFVDAVPGASNDMPGRLVFSTTADGASSPTERMRIDSDGTVLIGVNTKVIAKTTNPFVFFQAQATTTTSGLTIESYGNNIATRYHFGFTNPNGVVGTISTNGSATAYNTSSDYRLKENVVPLTGAVDRVNQLQVHRFNFIADPDKTVDGFIAHEAQAVVPECVTGAKDEVDADGNPVYQGIDQSKLIPLLTAALQEALTEIESLKARVTALEP